METGETSRTFVGSQFQDTECEGAQAEHLVLYLATAVPDVTA